MDFLQDIFNGPSMASQPLATQVREMVLTICRLCELDSPTFTTVSQKLAALPRKHEVDEQEKEEKEKKKKCPLLIVDSPHFLPENPSDLEGSLRNFFNLGLLEENSRSMRVLKLMSFAVAVSSRKRLSDAVNEKYVKKTFFFSVCPLLSSFLCSQRFPFVEDPKSLCINVRFNENGHITVFHSRMEQAASPQPEFKFHFIWDCTFIFETYSNKLRTEVGILVSLFAFSFFLSDSEFWCRSTSPSLNLIPK